MIDLESVEEAQGVTQTYKEYCTLNPGFNNQKGIKSSELIKFIQTNASALGR